MELRFKLLDELLSIGCNFKPDESAKVEVKLKEYLKNNEDDFLIRDALIILKTFEADYKYNDLKTCCELSVPIFERLNNTSEWNIYDFRILTYVIHYADTYLQTHALATKALKELESHSHERLYHPLKLNISLNTTSRLLRAKFYENDTQKSDENISELFSKYINLTMSLCVGEDFIFHQAGATVRKGIFYGDTDLINSTFKFLKKKGEHELYKVLQDELREYKYEVEYDKIAKKQFDAIVGENVRRLRTGLDMTRKDFARLLDVTLASISLIESGNRSIPSYSVHKLSKALDVPFEDFYYRTETVGFDTAGKEVLIGQMNTLARTFREEQLAYTIHIMKAIIELSS